MSADVAEAHAREASMRVALQFGDSALLLLLLLLLRLWLRLWLRLLLLMVAHDDGLVNGPLQVGLCPRSA